MYPLRLISGTLTLLSFAGCQHFQANPLDPSSSQQSLISRSLHDPGLTEFIKSPGVDPGSPWDLQRLFLAGYYFSPELDIASSRVDEASGAQRTAETRPNPQISFTPGYNQDAAGVTPWSFGYALNLPLEIRGQRRLRQSTAQLEVEAAHLRFAQARWALWSTLRHRLVELHAAENATRLWREQQPLLRRAAELVEAQIAAGEVSPLEATRAHIALHQAEIDARASERDVTAARSRIAEALGVPLAALADIQFSYSGLNSPLSASDAPSLRHQAVQHRIDLVQALSAYAAAEAGLQQEVRRQWPDFAIGPGYNLDQGDGKWALAFNLTLPVFNQNQGPIATAEARRATAAAEFLAVQNRVLAEVDRAWTHYASAQQDLSSITALKAQLQRQAQLVQAQQAAGETSQLDVVRAQIELAHGTRAALHATIQVELAIAAADDAAQNPYSLPLSRESLTVTRPRPLP